MHNENDQTRRDEEIIPASSSPSVTHTHSGSVPLGAAQRTTVASILVVIVLPLAIATIIGLVMLWPRGELVGSQQIFSSDSRQQVAEVTFIADSTDEFGQTDVRALVDGVEVPVHVPFDIVENGLRVGSHIQVVFEPANLNASTPYIFYDFNRDVPIFALVVLYALVVLAVARLKGLAAMVGLGVSLATVMVFMLPALLDGENPIPVVLVGASAMMFASIYLAHGISIRTTTAVIGTFAGLVVTGILAAIFIFSASLTGSLSDDAIALAGQVPGMRLNLILLCGVILAGLGALNDVTITQVSTVWELYAANPATPRRRVFAHAMVIGRDHIASTVYTLAFAYVGTSLPLLMSAAIMDRSFLEFVTVGQISEEIVRTLVASIGLVLAIPMTTAVASALAPVAPGKRKVHA